MNRLLTITSIVEGATGAGLIFMPAILVSILFGISLEGPVSFILCYITGAALISLAIASWSYRNSGSNAVGITKTLLFYNVAAAIILGYAALGQHLYGIALWPVVIVHAGFAIWCASALR